MKTITDESRKQAAEVSNKIVSRLGVVVDTTRTSDPRSQYEQMTDAIAEALDAAWNRGFEDAELHQRIVALRKAAGK